MAELGIHPLKRQNPRTETCNEEADSKERRDPEEPREQTALDLHHTASRWTQAAVLLGLVLDKGLETVSLGIIEFCEFDSTRSPSFPGRGRS